MKWLLDRLATSCIALVAACIFAIMGTWTLLDMCVRGATEALAELLGGRDWMYDAAEWLGNIVMSVLLIGLVALPIFLIFQ